jgi:hypothetical protein
MQTMHLTGPSMQSPETVWPIATKPMHITTASGNREADIKIHAHHMVVASKLAMSTQDSTKKGASGQAQ